MKEPNYKSIVPENSFIGQYLSHCEAMETAQAYDFWCALWLLSVAVRRSIYVDRPGIPVFLNLYAILVAESGITRKSTAIGVAEKIARRLYEHDPSLLFIQGRVTPREINEQLYEQNKKFKQSHCAIVISELAVGLGVERSTQTLPVLLTDVYDCPATRTAGYIKAGEAITHNDVFVSLLSASTPSWLYKSVNPNVIAGGFTSRCMFIVSSAPKQRIAWATSSTDKTEIILAKLQEIQSAARGYKTINITDGAKKTYSSWYARIKPVDDPFLSSFQGREADHVLRIAAFLCLNDNTYVIQTRHINSALSVVGYIRQSSHALFSEIPEQTRWVSGWNRLRDALLIAGQTGLPRSKLYLTVRTYLDNDEFSALIDVLHEIEAIQLFRVTQPRGRPSEIIRGTKNLTATKTNLRLVERLSSTQLT